LEKAPYLLLILVLGGILDLQNTRCNLHTPWCYVQKFLTSKRNISLTWYNEFTSDTGAIIMADVDIWQKLLLFQIK